MDLLQSKVYSEILLREDSASGRMVQALVSGPRAKLVHCIRYSPRDPQPIYETRKISPDDDDSEENGGHDPSIKLSPETQNVLQSLHLFSNLDTFRFRLEGNEEEWNLEEWPQQHDHFAGYADEYNPMDEEDEPWRKLLNDSLAALSASAGAFDKLEIYHLPPIPPEMGSYSTFRTPAWSALLGNLTSLDIQLVETAENYATGNMTRVHGEFLSGLGETILGHLSAVEHLRVAGRRDACIAGCYYDDPLLWSSLRMPRLKVWEVEWARAEDEVAGFIRNHSSSLERVSLKHCFANSRYAWWSLFNTIHESNPTELIEFEVIPVGPEYFRDEDNSDSRRFPGVFVNESYGDLQLQSQSDEEDEQDDEDEENKVDKSSVLAKLANVHDMANRNRSTAKPSYM